MGALQGQIEKEDAILKFVIVKPKERTIETVDAKELVLAEEMAGLKPNAVDHGTLSRSLAYVVYEFGLFVPAEEQSYFSIGHRLIAGPCVLYGYDERGDTVDVLKSQIPDVRWYLGKNDVEAAIDAGEIMRPKAHRNGVKLWQWPEPPPPELRP